jgi:hypothetical protein
MRSDTEAPSSTRAKPGDGSAPLPTAPCSVVWSKGHAYVLEPLAGRPRWLGVDDRGRAQALSGADLQRRGWTRTCKR